MVLAANVALREVSLDDKYAAEGGRVYLTGTQALVRLPLMQRRRDLAAGHNTAGFISGYRGSPLGGYDLALWRAGAFLADHHIQFQPGVNEEIAATSVWGSQQVNLWPGGTHDGVFGVWYGKGPGVDRCGDVFKHANFAGTAALGGVLAFAGDDHACKSSTVPHQSEHALAGAMMPVLNPAGVQEILDLGLHGWAMSRYAGLWVAFKTIAETIDASASVAIDPDRFASILPDDFEMPPGGLNIRNEGHAPLVQEHRLMRHKIYAALAYVRANRLDRVVHASAGHRFGIVTCGKSYLDVLQALELLGIDEPLAVRIGLSIYKPAMTWPLEPDGVRAFAEGLDELVVVEEKRALIENQLKEQLYNWRADRRPVVVGKFDEAGDWILPSVGELSPATVAIAIGRRLLRRLEPGAEATARIAERLAFVEERRAERDAPHPGVIARMPHYCSGCPHNISTKVPDGARALAGIGCHYMAIWMPDRPTETFAQMGGEGAAWIGQAPFTRTPHVFVNIGDGTYFHSGILALRGAVAAGAPITYKLLYNDAVAMTGGQPIDATVPMIARQVAAEGVGRIVVVTDDPDRYAAMGHGVLPPGTPVEHRDEMPRIQRELAEYPGVSVLIYDQTCAAEKRRRRKRGTLADPARRVVINELVCEGCGDCSTQSNCLSVVPVETEFGVKRTIDQSSCNKDTSCLNGFCPSLVTVEGGTLRRPPPTAGDPADGLPEPGARLADGPYGILVTGIGGTGVVTIGALLGMAAHLEGLGVSVLDQMGLAQKGGAVASHVRLARDPADLTSVRVPVGSADLILGCDLVVAASPDSLSRIRPGHTAATLNTSAAITSDFINDRTFTMPIEAMVTAVTETIDAADLVDTVPAGDLARTLLADGIAANLFMLGHAFQRGRIPLSSAAILRAIELNGVAIDANRLAFAWGRLAAHDPDAVAMAAQRARPARPDSQRLSESLDELVSRRVAWLERYQDTPYGRRYGAAVRRVADAETAISGARVGAVTGTLAASVARNLFKLMAYKDEYEVARLFTDGAFTSRIRGMFDGKVQLKFHLSPPLFAQPDPNTGRPRKVTYGPGMMTVFRLLARLKFLRGTWADPFGRTAERRAERALIADYLETVEILRAGLTAANLDLAIRIAEIPDGIRGYGPVKEAAIQAASHRSATLLAEFQEGAGPDLAAAAE